MVLEEVNEASMLIHGDSVPDDPGPKVTLQSPM